MRPVVILHMSRAAITLRTGHALQMAKSMLTLVHSALVVVTAKDFFKALLKGCLTLPQLLSEGRACMHVTISQSATLQNKARSAPNFSINLPCGHPNLGGTKVGYRAHLTMLQIALPASPLRPAASAQARSGAQGASIETGFPTRALLLEEAAPHRTGISSEHPASTHTWLQTKHAA